MDILILAIESSCDETSAAVLKNRVVLSNVVASQAIHTSYGGVVPELASREHQKNIVPVIDQAIKQSGIVLSDIHAVAFTRGPGLMGALLVGVSFAKGLAQALAVPLIEVNHMEAHVLAHFIQSDASPPELPFLCLTVSGGHTQIVKVIKPLEMEVIGKTLDDAAGEAFDKTGMMLGLNYPAGPAIDRLAQNGNPHRFSFPHPKIQGLDFSFSGFKTAVLYFLQNQLKNDSAFIDQNRNDLCASIQFNIIGILIAKLKRAAKESGIKNIAIAGGVSANSELRRQIKETGDKNGWKTFIPPVAYTTDNAAMIGIAAYFKYHANEFTSLDIKADPRLKIH